MEASPTPFPSHPQRGRAVVETEYPTASRKKRKPEKTRTPREQVARHSSFVAFKKTDEATFRERERDDRRSSRTAVDDCKGDKEPAVNPLVRGRSFWYGGQAPTGWADAVGGSQATDSLSYRRYSVRRHRRLRSGRVLPVLGDVTESSTYLDAVTGEQIDLDQLTSERKWTGKRLTSTEVTMFCLGLALNHSRGNQHLLRADRSTQRVRIRRTKTDGESAVVWDSLWSDASSRAMVGCLGDARSWDATVGGRGGPGRKRCYNGIQRTVP